jgi:hypothetical protein
MTKQTTIQPLTELDELLKEKKNIERIISHYREEYKRVRIMVRDYKHKLRELNVKIAQMTKPPIMEE